ncbi:NAD(P)H-binding protein [Saccharopolyspora sp. NPDC050642]|uniref:NAD(P)H-binding protein n=1 Tax=Saccharopolyspora sp. NPDC050642 TaxID=3157099 RepID=UPI0033DFFF23
MTARATILVTGATGNVGRQILAHLLAKPDVAIRAMVRTPAMADLPDGVEVVRGNLAEPESLHGCLRGVDAVFLMWPLHTGEVLPAVLEVIATQARRVVFLGSGGVGDLTMDQQQQLIEQRGLESTVIRPSTFAVNALWWAKQIRAGDVVRGAYGELPLAMLHEADIAAVAVQALTSDGHDGATYRLTGPQVLSQAEQVRIIGEAIGRPLRWEELSPQDARQQLVADGFPPSFVDVLLDAYATMITWPVPEITTTIEAVTGTPARTFRQWVIDHATDFQSTTGVLPQPVQHEQTTGRER